MSVLSNMVARFEVAGVTMTMNLHVWYSPVDLSMLVPMAEGAEFRVHGLRMEAVT